MPDRALLVMDVQETIVARFGDDGILEPIGRAIGAARRGGVPVIYVKVAFREGHPEVSPRNKSFAAIAFGHGFVGEGTCVHPAVAPAPGDIEVVKKRVSAAASCCPRCGLRPTSTTT